MYQYEYSLFTNLSTKPGQDQSVVKDIRRRTRKKYSSEEKIRIVLEGFQSRMSAIGRKQTIKAQHDLTLSVRSDGDDFS